MNRDTISQQKEKFNKTLLSKLLATKSVSKNIDNFRLLEFILKKMELSKSLYILLATLSEENPENSELIYDFSPNFQFHLFYIKESVQILRKIFKKNEELLYRLGHGEINFNMFETDKKEKNSQSSILNVIINIVDTSNSNKIDTNSLNFSRQTKIVFYFLIFNKFSLFL